MHLLQKNVSLLLAKLKIIPRTENAHKSKSVSDILFTVYFQKFVSSLLDFCVYGVVH